MKKIFFILIFLTSISTFSQGPFGTSKQRFKRKILFLELIGGISLPSMIFNDTDFDEYKSDTYYDHTEGLSLRFQFSHNFSVGTQVTYRKQGVSYTEIDNYKLTTGNVNFHVPFEYESYISKNKHRYSKIVLFAGPYIAQNIGGKIKSDLVNQEITGSNFSKLDFGLESGIGFRIPTFSTSSQSNITIKASYMLGLANTYPEVLNYNAEELSQMLLSQNGSRKNSGFRFIICLEIPMRSNNMDTFTAGGNGKKTFKRFVNVR